MTIYLGFEDVVQLAHDAVDPAKLLIRDLGLLPWATERPRTRIGSAARIGDT